MRKAFSPAVPFPVTSEPPLPAPRRARSIDTHDRLLAAGRELLGSRGYEATSIEDITAHAGVATGVFYRHFRSKRQLLVTLMAEVVDCFRLTDLELPVHRTVRAALRSHLATMFREDEIHLFRILRPWRELAITDTEIARLDGQIRTWTEMEILLVLRQFLRHPQARRDCDAPTFARLINDHLWTLLARADALDPDEWTREILVTAEIIYHYFFRDAD